MNLVLHAPTGDIEVSDKDFRNLGDRAILKHIPQLKGTTILGPTPFCYMYTIRYSHCIPPWCIEALFSYYRSMYASDGALMFIVSLDEQEGNETYKDNIAGWFEYAKKTPNTQIFQTPRKAGHGGSIKDRVLTTFIFSDIAKQIH